MGRDLGGLDGIDENGYGDSMKTFGLKMEFAITLPSDTQEAVFRSVTQYSVDGEPREPTITIARGEGAETLIALAIRSGQVPESAVWAKILTRDGEDT